MLTPPTFAALQAKTPVKALYMIRKLPSMLHHLDGNPAYGEWEGGLFGVLAREMEDANTAASRWAAGSASE
jgi:hypothetical protein